jgi:hypothetical protein
MEKQCTSLIARPVNRLEHNKHIRADFENLFKMGPPCSEQGAVPGGHF